MVDRLSGIVLAALLAGSASATEPPQADNPFEQSLRALEELDASGYPEQAASTVIETLLDHPEHRDAPRVRLALSRFQRSNQHYFGELRTLRTGAETHMTWRPWFELALLDAHLQAEDWDGLERQLRLMDGFGSEAYYYAAWAEVGRGDIRDAQTHLRKVRGPLQDRAVAFAGALDGWDDIPQRNKTLAGALSLVPGLGHVYAGRADIGLLSLILNGGLAAGTVYFYGDDQPVVGTACAIVLASTWISTITDASARARHYNVRQRVKRQRTLQSDWWIEARVTGEEPPLEVVPPPDDPDAR